MTASESINQSTQVTGTRLGVTRYPRYDAAELGFENYWYPGDVLANPAQTGRSA